MSRRALVISLISRGWGHWYLWCLIRFALSKMISSFTYNFKNKMTKYVLVYPNCRNWFTKLNKNFVLYCSSGILEFAHSEWYESHCPSATVGSFINWWHKLADITYTSVTLCLKKSNSIKTLSISSQPHLSAMINLRKTTLVFLICCDRVKSRILHHQVPKLVFHVPVMLLSYFRILLPVHCFIKKNRM